MVSDPSTDHIVRWTDDGNAFLVLDEFAFAKQLLPLYFRHKNFSSFIRQLNFYNFSKRQVDGKYIRLQHPYFKRNQLQLLQLIKRKSTHDTHNNVKATVASLTAQVKELKGQYDDLFKIQQQILYIFSRYMRANPIPRTLAGGRERLMLGAEDGDGTMGGGGLMPHPNVELVEDGDDEEEDEHRVEHDGEDNEGRASETKDGGLRGMEENGDTEVEAFDDGGEVGGFDDEEDGGDDEDTKEASEATAQAFAELQNLQDIIDQMPGKQEFLSSIPPVPTPTERPNKRRGRAASPPATAPASSSSSSATAAGSKQEPNPYEPSMPPAAMSTFNAFPVTDASIALPPLYPSQSYINQQTATAASSTAAAPAATILPHPSTVRSKPKLLYSQEHYDALTNRDGQQHSDDDSKHSSQQSGSFGEPALYTHSPYNGWSAASEQKDSEPLSASLFTPSNVRQSSWMPADMPPGSPQLANYLNADDSTAETDYGMSSLPLHSEPAEHSTVQTTATGTNGGQYGWPTYHY